MTEPKAERELARRRILGYCAGAIVLPGMAGLLGAVEQEGDVRAGPESPSDQQQGAALPKRRLWLRRLEAAVRDTVAAGQAMSDQARYMAGLTRIENVYLVPEHQDVIIEGPAEDAWQLQSDGSALGAKSGQPLMQLDDFLVALRNVTNRGQPPSLSLEPRRETLQRMRNYLNAQRGKGVPKADEERERFQQEMQDLWGAQDAVTGGVPTNTRFNKVMLDADWEMKHISLGTSQLEFAEIPSYVDLEYEEFRKRLAADPRTARQSPNSSRFWFYPAYDDFLTTEQGDAVQIPKRAVQLLTETYFRSLNQQRRATAEPSPAAKQFVDVFTAQFDALARANPLYADLRNLFDLIALCRLLQDLDAFRRTGWDFEYFVRSCPLRAMQVPATRPGVVAVRFGEVKTQDNKQYAAFFPMWGGVAIDVRPRLAADMRIGQQLRARLDHLRRAGIAGGRWWQRVV